MSWRTLLMTPTLYDYLLSVSLREPEILRQLRQETAKLPQGNMQISPEQGQFMALLVELIAAKKTLDIGTFTGYSALAVALALPDEGTVITCDISKEWTDVAQQYWQEAGVAAKIDLRLAPAEEILDKLLAKGEANSFDFIFIDANKLSYDLYYEKSLLLLRQGGLIAIDNTLQQGRVADLTCQDKITETIRKLNQKIHRDERVTISMLPIGDGLTLVRKK